MFDTVLVADRGEIALRVLHTLRRLHPFGGALSVCANAPLGPRHKPVFRM